MMPETATIIYQSDQIEVLHAAADSDTIVIFFASKNEVADGRHFWGEAPARKAGVAAIGFMPRSANWFPASDFTLAVDAIRAITRRYRIVVTYGQSMGAYAALKYARRLGAGTTLAFAPQWSIDPRDLGANDLRFQRHFQADLHSGMAIASKDIIDNTHIFFDPHYPEDAFNVRSIASLSPSVKVIPIPFTAHFPIELYASTPSFVALLDACCNRDANRARALGMASRRHAPGRIPGIANAALARRPRLAAAILDQHRHCFSDRQAAELNNGLRKQEQQLCVQQAECAAAADSDRLPLRIPMAELLMFTCANRKYEAFVPLYATFALLHPCGARVEVGVEDEQRFLAENAAFIAAVEREAPGRLLVRSVPWADPAGRRYLPNTVRFITEPFTRADYVYIGDVDVLILDPVFPDAHLAFSAHSRLPYANSVRVHTIGTGNERTTGLHFTRWDAYYPLPDIAGLQVHGGADEVVLSRLLERKGLPLQTAEWWRPVPGIHASPNRAPISADGMDWDIGPWVRLYQQLTRNPAFERMRAALPTPSREILETIESNLSAFAPPA